MSSAVPRAFHTNEMWQHIEWLACGTGLDERATAGTLRVLPNPCSNEAMVYLPPGTAVGAIDMLDALGMKVGEARPDGRIDTSLLAPGSYSVRITMRSGTRIARFIKL